MKKFNSFKDLLVWQKSMNLTVAAYSSIKKLPQIENFGLISQMQRSVVSVPSNIAEGYGRNQTRDFIRFLQISMGSLYELQTQMEICYRLAYIEKKEYDNFDHDSVEIAKMLSALIRKLKESL
ncbi:four helix bundle protein [Marinilabilia salmonicolor]|jgi:four helix bundle protein|uniref:Four helix bundle protein n=1 Tax=Marinilabilia salmonicolor TaxID=989 RepID=A0A368V4L4_9BACT|nr:four helix bundle protein [Marinilabilia salmonicolor]RCW36097.1 four helix bundle protein [Marinilabilia salmonicolor]